MDCILEDKVTGASASTGVTSAASRGGRRSSRIPSGSRGSSRRGSEDALLPQLPTSTTSERKQETFSYWMRVTVVPEVDLDHDQKSKSTMPMLFRSWRRSFSVTRR